MKRLTAFLIGVLIIVNAQTSFGLIGCFEDPGSDPWPTDLQAWGQIKGEGTHCQKILTLIKSKDSSEDRFKIKRDCSSDETGDAYNDIRLPNYGIGWPMSVETN